MEWDAATGKKVRTFDASSKFSCCLAYSPDGHYVAVGSVDGSLSIFSAGEDGKRLHKIEAHSKTVRSVTFSHDSTMLVSCSDDGRVNMWDVKHASLVHTFSGHRKGVCAVSYSYAGLYFASSSHDGTVKIWDVSARQCCYSFNEHKGAVFGLSFNEKGNTLVSVGDDKSVIRYQVY